MTYQCLSIDPVEGKLILDDEEIDPDEKKDGNREGEEDLDLDNTDPDEEDEDDDEEDEDNDDDLGYN